jgi:hypothetical protein
MADDNFLVINNLTIDPIIFTQGYPTGCGPFQCTAHCCIEGVFIDVKEVQRIREHKEMVLKYMDETQPHNPEQWFEQRSEHDADFPSGQCVGTETHNNKCVFLNKQGLCSLQVAAIAEGLPKWSLKPFYCVLFPLTIMNGTLTFDDFRHGETQCCSLAQDHTTPLFKACRKELTYVLGREGYAELEAYYSANILVQGDLIT